MLEKQKEILMVIDFRKSSAVVPDHFINGVKVEAVTEYKYLGTVLDSKLNVNANTFNSDFLNKKCQSRLHCLRKLRSFHVNTDILCTFYHCFLESVLTFSFVCWYDGLSVKCNNLLDRVVNVGGKIVGSKAQEFGPVV